MASNVFVMSYDGEDLDAFARRCFASLGIVVFQKRDSYNWAGGEYYLGMALFITITIGLADNNEFSEYDYVIWLETNSIWIEDQSFLSGVVDLVARGMVLEGYHVACPVDSSRFSSTKIVYEKNPNADGYSANEVVRKYVSTESS